MSGYRCSCCMLPIDQCHDAQDNRKMELAEERALEREEAVGALFSPEQPPLRTSSNWLRQIEALTPGDRCEFHYPARSQWLPGTVVVNGGSGYWHIRDESDAEGWRGRVTESIYIEHVRLPGQEEAWR